jgi:small nuclear ribonucleoprotein (snRNP)-like protein
MHQLLNYRMRVIIQDNREFIGQLMAFDKHMNIVLADCEEFRRIGKGKKEEKVLKRTLGLIVLRGEIIVSMSIEGPPPPEVFFIYSSYALFSLSGRSCARWRRYAWLGQVCRPRYLDATSFQHLLGASRTRRPSAWPWRA